MSSPSDTFQITFTVESFMKINDKITEHYSATYKHGMKNYTKFISDNINQKFDIVLSDTRFTSVYSEYNNVCSGDQSIKQSKNYTNIIVSVTVSRINSDDKIIGSDCRRCAFWSMNDCGNFYKKINKLMDKCVNIIDTIIIY